MKFLYRDIQDKAIEIDYLEVQSFEMNVYLVNITCGQYSGLIYDDKDKPKRFHSTQQIRESFSNCRVKQAAMMHDSPYDEMIGNPPKASHSTALPFTMELPY